MKKTTAIIVSVLAAVLIWLGTNLAGVSTAIVSVPVLVHSSLNGHTDVASDEASVVAMVSASGFRLVSLQMRSRKTVDISVDPSDLALKEGDFFLISSGELTRHAGEIFGNGVTVLNFVSQTITVRFPRENCKMVPIVPVSVLTYRPQYMAMEEIKVTPDSVLIYGEPALLENIEQVGTQTITKTDLRRSIHGVAKLEVPFGTRLSEEQVSYAMDVTRYVEVRSTANITVRGLPSGRRLELLPGKVEVACRYVFPRAGQTSSVPELYVDYSDFATSITGKCIIKYDALPAGAIALSINPQVCECIETFLR